MMAFKGARFSFQKPVGHHLALTHSIILNGKESAYKLQPTYIGTLRQKSPQESYPICIGEVDHAGRLMANIIHEAADNLKLKYQLQVCLLCVRLCVCACVCVCVLVLKLEFGGVGGWKSECTQHYVQVWFCFSFDVCSMCAHDFACALLASFRRTAPMSLVLLLTYVQ